MPPIAILGAAAIGAGATMWGAGKQAKAAKQASDVQAEYAQKGIDLQREQMDSAEDV